MVWWMVVVALAADVDADGFDDAVDDNCPGIANPDQTDDNADGYGDACVDPTATVDGSAVLGSAVRVMANARIGAGAVVGNDAFIGPRVQVGDDASIGDGVVLARRAHVGDGASLGGGVMLARAAQVEARATIGSDAVVGYGAQVEQDAVIGSDATLGSLTRIGPSTDVGHNSVLARGVDIGMCAVIDDGVVVGPSSIVGDFSSVGVDARIRKAAVLAESVVVDDDARIGRDVAIEMGGFVGASAAVRAQAAIGPCHGVADGAVLARWTQAQTMAPSCAIRLVDDQAGADIWTASVYAFDGVSQRPGGGKNEDILRIGGWGDSYYSLIRFELADLPVTAASAQVELYRQPRSSGGTTSFYVDRVMSAWDWTTTGTGRDNNRLWWADKPSSSQIAGPISPVSASNWQTIDVTSLYNGWTTGAMANHGIQMRPSSTSNNWIHFQSSTPCTGESTSCGQGFEAAWTQRCQVPRLRIAP